MKSLGTLSVLGAFLIAPWLGFSSIANAGQPVCRCWSAEGLLAALVPVMDDIDPALEGAVCDTIPEGLVAPGEGPTFIAEVIGAVGGVYVSQSVTPASEIKGTTDKTIPPAATFCSLDNDIQEAWTCMRDINAVCRGLGF